MLFISVLKCIWFGLLAKIKVFAVLPAHWPLVLDAGTVLVSVPPLICAGFVNCHCTVRWAVLDNTHGKDAMQYAEGCCTATTMALTSIKQKCKRYGCYCPTHIYWIQGNFLPLGYSTRLFFSPSSRWEDYSSSHVWFEKQSNTKELNWYFHTPEQSIAVVGCDRQFFFPISYSYQDKKCWEILWPGKF